MEYVKLGKTGLDVSRLCLGCMSFGDAVKWPSHKWVLNEEDSRPIIKRALELGINFFDTANIYSLGASEEIVGRALRAYADRDEIVVATKVLVPMRPGPNGGGLSRKHVMEQIDASLRRLGMDYVDLYIIHRWDYNTPIEETMSALHDIVKAGKARYIGASAMYAWQFQKALFTAEKHNWTRFVSMQNHYNLLYREEEREMMPLCADEGIASTPYSPLAGGRLTRDLSVNTKRYETDEIARYKYDRTTDIDRPVIERLAEVAANRNIPRSNIALAWLMQQEAVAAPIIGATRISQLEELAGALSVSLTPDETRYLEEPYVPHNVVGAVGHARIAQGDGRLARRFSDQLDGGLQHDAEGALRTDEEALGGETVLGQQVFQRVAAGLS